MDILKELYYGNIDESERPLGKKYKLARKKECELYDKLNLTLNEEQKDLLEKFIESFEDSCEIEIIERYKQGFKTGLLIALESNNIKL